jgi:hypothetical protein
VVILAPDFGFWGYFVVNLLSLDTCYPGTYNNLAGVEEYAVEEDL